MAPMAALAVPGLHGKQLAEPFIAEKVPAGQGLQAGAPGPEKVPAAHGAQNAAKAAPAAALAVPAGHKLHSGWPYPSWNCPGGQGAQVPFGKESEPGPQDEH